MSDFEELECSCEKHRRHKRFRGGEVPAGWEGTIGCVYKADAPVVMVEFIFGEANGDGSWLVDLELENLTKIWRPGDPPLPDRRTMCVPRELEPRGIEPLTFRRTFCLERDSVA